MAERPADVSGRLSLQELNRATLARQMLLAREKMPVLRAVERLDRARVISDDHRRKVATANLRILPTFLVDGRVGGTWTIERARTSAVLVLERFGGLPRKAQAELEAEGRALVGFAEPDSKTREVRFI